ncbi:MAG: dipeptidyl peptidase 3 [Massilibacteroides sp.]|nr:dipeptidyl peptidase 3 [Massilibacteroides sp.]
MKNIFITTMSALALTACSGGSQSEGTSTSNEFTYKVDKFADLEILRYKVPEFETLSLAQKELLYHLSEAALMGRDILYDQNCRYNLAVRRTLEAIYTYYKGNKEDENYKAFVVYLKRVWFSNGIHHHYAEEKIKPGFDPGFLDRCLRQVPVEALPLRPGSTVDAFERELLPVIFNPVFLAKRTVQSGDQDLIKASANHYYGENISQEEVEDFYTKMKKPNDETPLSYGLNSRLVKEEGKLVEKVWKVGGLYTEAIEKIVAELKQAERFAENEKQKAVIATLIAYYQTGDLKTFDAYSILWVNDLDSKVDFVNGFTETYGDPLGIKASWESTVNFKNEKATERSKIISGNAQWFEDHSPINDRFKKKQVKGVTAKVITVAMLGGDCYPSTPIGINLPNADWIRKDYGSKSVTIDNITEAYDQASKGNGFMKEFVWSDTEQNLITTYGYQTDNLHTDLHECLGHGSGIILPGVSPEALKAYSSTIEEARADLFGLYYMADAKIVKLGLLPNPEAYKAAYYRYMMNGLLTQLVRIEPGKDIEEAHMRNRMLIAEWVFEHGAKDKVVEMKQKEGKTYVVVNDYRKLRTLFGELLAEIQRCKSEGDFAAAKNLVETYGVKVDQTLHKEVLKRYAGLHLSPYKGFVNPVMKLVKDEKGNVIDVKLDYTEGYAAQMLRYSKDYSFLPTYTD